MGLSLKNFAKILKQIEEKHWLVNGRMIKYVDSSFDMRTKSFWRIKLRAMTGLEEVFSNTNRPEEERGDLFHEIMQWLEDGE